MNLFIQLVTLVGLLLPLVVKLIAFVGALTNNNQILLISERASIIVNAIEQQYGSGSGSNKKAVAIASLRVFANEVKIPLTETQAEEYVENAVRIMRGLDVASEVIINAKEE